MAIVQIIEDSISEEDVRLTTYQLRYWRGIHAEVLTHRQFTRNGRSSRAVPSDKLLAEEPFVPQFGYNKPGMQAGDQMSAEDQREAERIWMDMVNYTKAGVKKLYDLKVHKQWANRPLEWFGYIDVVLSSVHWANFDGLRSHGDAQPEFRELADLMISAREASTPKLLKEGEWHLPYVTEDERHEHDISLLLKLSTARCARVSYKAFDGDDSIAKELDRFTRLVGSTPSHSSPAEHQATPDKKVYSGSTVFPKASWKLSHLHGNLTGWIQHRHLIPGHYMPDSWESIPQ